MAAALQRIEMKTNAPADAIVDFRQQTGSGKINFDGIFEMTTLGADIALRSCMCLLIIDFISFHSIAKHNIAGIIVALISVS